MNTEKLIAEGWTMWVNGNPPPNAELVVDVMLKNMYGSKLGYVPELSGGVNWSYGYTNPIIAYRLTTNADYFKGVERAKETAYMPEVGDLLDTVRVFSSSEPFIKEWFNKPMCKVVGHHMDGVKFFVEYLAGSGSISVFDSSLPEKQYRPIQSERDKVIEAAEKLIKAHQWTPREVLEDLYTAGMLKLPEQG